MGQHRLADDASQPLEGGRVYRPRHLRLDVIADTEPETVAVGGTHAALVAAPAPAPAPTVRRAHRGFGVLGRLGRTDPSEGADSPGA